MEGAIGNWRWPSNDNDVTCRLAQALSDHAVYWVIERRYGEYGDPSPADNLSARGQMRSDLYETLEFLSASLATGEPRLFNDYVQWRLDVLGFRSQQTIELVAVLGLLAEFFAQRFGPISGIPVGLGYLRIAIGLSSRRFMRSASSGNGTRSPLPRSIWRARLPRPSIVVGGLATSKMERVWEWIGADEWFPDAERAPAGRS